MSENPRMGRQARNLTTNVPKILDLKKSSEQMFFRKLPLGAPVAFHDKLSRPRSMKHSFRKLELVAVSISEQFVSEILRQLHSCIRNDFIFADFCNYFSKVYLAWAYHIIKSRYQKFLSKIVIAFFTRYDFL